MEDSKTPVYIPEDDEAVIDAVVASGAPATPEEEEENAEV